MSRVVLVAALEREVAPLTRRMTRGSGAEKFPIFDDGQTAIVCGGMGSTHAADATRWVIAGLKPEVVMSIGFAGALVPDFNVGDVITPGTVIDASTREAFSVRTGGGVLVTNSAVSAERGKRDLASQFAAQAVDMEAAAVARVARENGVPFFAVKAISDEAGFVLPPVQYFVSDAGQFRTFEFLAHVALRPALWPRVLHLGVNARRASSQLCNWLENQMMRDFRDIREGVCGHARL